MTLDSKKILTHVFFHPNAPFCQVIAKSEQVGFFWYILVHIVFQPIEKSLVIAALELFFRAQLSPRTEMSLQKALSESALHRYVNQENAFKQ